MSTPAPKDTIITALNELGLGQNEANLYEVLINTPDATIPLLQKKSPFSRTMLYYILQSLEQYELIETKQVGKKTVYNAAAPERLEGFINEQEKSLRQQKEQLHSIIGDLRSAYNLAHNKPGVRFFEGRDGFREALEDTLQATETIYTFADMDAIAAYVDDINKPYVKKRQELGIDKKLLVIDSPTARAYLTAQGANHTNTRFLPKHMVPFKTGMQIYNNTISYFTLRADNIMAVLIRDADIYRMHRSLFEILWELAGKGVEVGHGTDSRTIFND